MSIVFTSYNFLHSPSFFTVTFSLVGFVNSKVLKKIIYCDVRLVKAKTLYDTRVTQFSIFPYVLVSIGRAINFHPISRRKEGERYKLRCNGQAMDN